MNFGLSGFPHITIGHMQRLSGLDASFLYLETAAQPLHVCSILELDTSTMPGGYTFDRMRDELGLRIKAMPQFREKLADSRFNPDHPVWVEDDDFDVDRHLHRIGLPSPGGRQELAEICGHIASLPLDRSRPLWEMWVIENIAGTDAHDRRPAGGHDEGAPRRRGRRDRRQPDVAAVQHRTRRARPRAGRRRRRRQRTGDRGQRRDEVRHPAVEVGQRGADDAVARSSTPSSGPAAGWRWRGRSPRRRRRSTPT